MRQHNNVSDSKILFKINVQKNQKNQYSKDIKKSENVLAI